MLKDKVRFQRLAGPEIFNILRIEPGSLIKFHKSFFQPLPVMQLDASLESLSGLFQVLFRRNTIDSADQSIGT